MNEKTIYFGGNFTLSNPDVMKSGEKENIAN